MNLLPSNIEYTGIDIAIHSPSSHLVELDFVENPLHLEAKRFDIIVAQGVFEYMGTVYTDKLREIAELLTVDGKLIATYTNFDHRNPQVYPIYNNVQPLEVFRKEVGEFFLIERAFPASYNWNHSQPQRKLVQSANRAARWEIPLVGRKLAVEYFFVCSKRMLDRGGT
jgi:cyclopropane fatty-acyl-phospholipid synthase-like methyltransferase